MIYDADAMDALPDSGWVRSYVEYGAMASDAPVVFHLGTALAVLSALAPDDLSIPWFGRKMNAHLWVLLAGTSATVRKSASAGIGSDMLTVVDPYRVGALPGTKEGYLDMLGKRNRQLLEISEFGDFLAHTKQGRYASTLKPVLMRAWDGRDTREAFAGSNVRGHERPRTSLVGACALPLLEQHTDPEDWASGFLNRFIVLLAPQQRYEPIPDHSEELAERAVAVTEDLALRSGQEEAGICTGFSPSARTLWKEWAVNLHERRQKLPPDFAALGARVEASALRAALVYSLDFGDACRKDTWELGEAEVYWATRLANLHHESGLAIMEGLAANAPMRDRRRVLLNLSFSDWKPYPQALRESGLLKRPFELVLETLLAEESVEKRTGAGGVVFLRRRTPEELIEGAILMADGRLVPARGRGAVELEAAPAQEEAAPEVPILDDDEAIYVD